MRALNSLTQNLIDNLTQILQNPEEDALQTLTLKGSAHAGPSAGSRRISTIRSRLH